MNFMIQGVFFILKKFKVNLFKNLSYYLQILNDLSNKQLIRPILYLIEVKLFQFNITPVNVGLRYAVLFPHTASLRSPVSKIRKFKFELIQKNSLVCK